MTTFRDDFLRVRITRSADQPGNLRAVQLTDPYTGEVLGAIPVTDVSSHEQPGSPRTFSFTVHGFRVDEVTADD